MKKYIFIILMLILMLFSCASKPEIIRKLIPQMPEKKQAVIQDDTIIEEKDNIRITIRYLNKIELAEIAEDNNPYLEDDTPLLTTFKIIIENNRDSRISFELNNAILLDGLGNQFNALTYESFKNLYPSSVYQKYEYSFVFDRYYTENVLTDDYHKREKAAKTLFKGGKIFPGIKVEGILPFERINERAKNITLILSDIILYDKEKKDKKIKKIEYNFQFQQKILRLID